MIELQLFRVRVVKSDQTSFLVEDRSPSTLIQEAVHERPSKELRRGHQWHIGNISPVDEAALRFAVGRTTSSILERYDETTGDFVEEELEAAPYTLALLDLHRQVLAIAKKSRLMPTTAGIGRKLESLLQDTSVARDHELRFEVTPLSDPDDFISYLRSAYAIRSFSISFRRPNPWDAEEDFHKPMEHLLQQSEGDQGKTRIKGQSLAPSTLEQLARSAATAGDDADARVQLSQGEQAVKKRLGATTVTLHLESLAAEEDFVEAVSKLRSLYDSLKGDE